MFRAPDPFVVPPVCGALETRSRSIQVGRTELNTHQFFSKREWTGEYSVV
ncbi:hypothetical protein CBL_05962 [Carabus blaptoides fortunei]